jgi:hypothetical protein
VSVNDRRLSDHYSVLEPHERFRVALEAAAREDFDERWRLAGHLPAQRLPHDRR